ncbi:colicin E3/pyocin S6 family cytotoxin [Pseudomonas abietaniphila]
MNTCHILAFPADSGLSPIYIVFSHRTGDHKYHSKPVSLSAFPKANQVRGKTRVHGGGYIRPRWVDHKGYIYKWDLRHGTVEKYNKRGIHLGEFDHNTGARTKEADPSRRIEP